MGVKGPIIALGVATLVGFGVAAVEPHLDRTEQDRDRTRMQQLVDQGADAKELEDERARQRGDAIRDADNRDRLLPGEHRPPELPRVRFRP